LLAIAHDKGLQFYGTQYEIIQSRAIAEQVVDALQLHKKPLPEETPLVQKINMVKSFPSRMVGVLVSTIEAAIMGEPASVSTLAEAARLDSLEQRRQDAIAQLRGALRVKPIPETQKEKEKFISPDRFEETQNLVQLKLNALQSSYIETNTGDK
jgi:uncharacterized protein involved in exopolysaccharide biosynthesis